MQQLSIMLRIPFARIGAPHEISKQRIVDGWEPISSNLIGAKLMGVTPADGVLYLKRQKIILNLRLGPEKLPNTAAQPV